MQTSAERDERRLAAGIRRREESAVTEAYARFGAITFGALVRMLGDRAAAEDVQQEVFLEVWRRGERYDPARGSLLSWIMTITKSRAIDHLRKRVPEPREPAVSSALADVEDPDAGIDPMIERWRMAYHLDRLPPEESELLRLRFSDGLSQTEISARTGVALGTVKMRMVQGLARLRVMLEAEEAA